MIKRRKFFQYAGLGSVGLALSTATPSLASTRADTSLPLAVGTPLKTFEYDTMTVAGDGRIKQRQSLKGQFFAESFSKELLEMVAITAATSSPRRGRRSPFFISKYPVTQSQWSAVAALPKVKRELVLTPAHFHGSNLPVESVSWLEAVEFCDRLTLHTGRQYQLPSEAQWEYACRAGTKTPFHTGETITSELADYVSTYRYKAEPAGRYRQSTLPVGKFLPNAFGLHDMHGNVWEWCADSWHTAHRYAPQKGRAWVVSKQATQQATQQVKQQAIQRAIRGGSWSDTPEKLRSASRSGYVETGLNRTIGFRVVAI
ncbi:MAG: formylglycine-generating enzyme family protein [Cyanobacteria bacterium J06560_2]